MNTLRIRIQSFSFFYKVEKNYKAIKNYKAMEGVDGNIYDIQVIIVSIYCP